MINLESVIGPSGGAVYDGRMRVSSQMLQGIRLWFWFPEANELSAQVRL
jgi:hypothetical protein